VSEAPISLRQVLSLVAAERSGDGDDTGGTGGQLKRLCKAAARALPASGVGISLMDRAGFTGVVAASDPESTIIEEMQFTLGEGPCHEAHVTRQPVLVPDLAEAGPDRWPAYAAAASDRDVGAVFSFPVQIGAAQLGAMDVYQRTAGPLPGHGVAQALTFAEAAAGFLIDGQTGLQGDELDPGLEDALQAGYQVHQAQGMVMVMLDVDCTEALVRLRAYAFAVERPLGDVVRDIVSRKLRLERD
jgi:GAF domain-containing protein